ncbi:hypothetical protein [Bradymonas sediminis]|uniref:Uncharacterized protein n=1 Tax=Bradymonas sediminis TaxID=1548548 RepID=A0A2Z4FHK5_9DELT|nr:hypothetical protein [Bradymonas sediminis]AWV88235.1 hypothetical protein DN745_02320 [Bradymonas sediminis]TDP77357.1 hypothetical protein DFR33_101257 [Bradymonas sediminis]
MSYNTRRAKRISSSLLLFFGLLLGAAWLSGCQAPECEQMTRCCAAIQDFEGVGKACGEMTAGISDPDTCRSVVSAAQAMLETREGDIPEACVLAE